MEGQIRLVSRKLGFADPYGGDDARWLLTASEAARRLGIPTRSLVRLISERRIRYVMVDGIAYVAEDALSEYEAKAS